MAYAVGPGIKAAMDALGDKPASDEVWRGQVCSLAHGEKNDYIYDKETGRIFVSYPFV